MNKNGAWFCLERAHFCLCTVRWRCHCCYNTGGIEWCRLTQSTSLLMGVCHTSFRRPPVMGTLQTAWHFLLYLSHLHCDRERNARRRTVILQWAQHQAKITPRALMHSLWSCWGRPQGEYRRRGCERGPKTLPGARMIQHPLCFRGKGPAVFRLSRQQALSVQKEYLGHRSVKSRN